MKQFKEQIGISLRNARKLCVYSPEAGIANLRKLESWGRVSVWRARGVHWNAYLASAANVGSAAALGLDAFHFLSVRAPALSPFGARHANAITGESRSHDFDFFADYLRWVRAVDRTRLDFQFVTSTSSVPQERCQMAEDRV